MDTEDTERCFRLQHNYSLPWALRQLNRFRRKADTSQVPFFDDKESGTCLLATSGQERGEISMSLEPLEPQNSLMQISLLLRLPQELLLQIMILLPYSSLYMVHQTCGILRHLLGGFEFKSFRLEMLRSNEEQYCITKTRFEQLRMVKTIFRRRSLCSPCGKLFDSGKLEERLRALWKPVRCTGCDKSHPELLFPQDRRMENRCVGLLGHFAACEHLKTSSKIPVIPIKKALEEQDEDITCDHPDHIISVYDKYRYSPSLHRFHPRIRYWSNAIGIRSQYSRTFPMMKIHRRQDPEDLDMRKIKSFLLKQLQELNGDGLCQHASGQLESIASFIILEKYCYFSDRYQAYYRHRCPDRSYVCHECGARYIWVYEDNCVTLRVRMNVSYGSPDSINWLSNLSFETDEHPILNSSTEHVLWCSNPVCGTGCGERWLLMVEIFKRHTMHYYLQDIELEFRCMTSIDRLPLTLEYQTFHDVADWTPGGGP